MKLSSGTLRSELHDGHGIEMAAMVDSINRLNCCVVLSARNSLDTRYTGGCIQTVVEASTHRTFLNLDRKFRIKSRIQQPVLSD